MLTTHPSPCISHSTTASVRCFSTSLYLPFHLTSFYPFPTRFTSVLPFPEFFICQSPMNISIFSLFPTHVCISNRTLTPYLVHSCEQETHPSVGAPVMQRRQWEEPPPFRMNVWWSPWTLPEGLLLGALIVVFRNFFCECIFNFIIAHHHARQTIISVCLCV